MSLLQSYGPRWVYLSTGVNYFVKLIHDEKWHVLRGVEVELYANDKISLHAHHLDSLRKQLNEMMRAGKIMDVYSQNKGNYFLNHSILHSFNI